MFEHSAGTDHSSSRLGEFTWYSRLAAWIGAAMLLVQSILGRDAGPVTILAVLLLGIGFLCFLIGLAVDSRLPGTRLLIGPGLSAAEPQSTASSRGATLQTESPSQSTQLQPAVKTVTPATGASVRAKKPEQKPSARAAASAQPVRGPGRRPKFRERAKKTDVQPEPRRVEPALEPPPAEEPPMQPTTTQAEPVPVGVPTEMLGPGHVGVGAECPRCGNALRLGQLAASCPVCGRTHHAVCWMENHFHCGALDCNGHGSLEAPPASPELDLTSHE